MLKITRSALALAACAMALLLAMPALGAQGKLEKIRVDGPALAGNLQGNDATRDVWVYTPPGYAQSTRRYPVIYFLHGYGVTAEVYVNDVLKLPAAADEAMSAGTPEFILVLPDAFTRFGGSWYSNSPTVGDWESFIARDLVRYIDGHYRTIARREGRGLAGHSMGGYGTLRIGMQRAQVFNAIYAMSAAIEHRAPDAATSKTQLARQTPELRSEPRTSSNGIQAQASAWAANPRSAPWFFDLPYDADGKPLPGVAGKWAANSLFLLGRRNAGPLKSLRGIAMDVGNADGLSVPDRQFSNVLKELGVPHDFEVYEGTHGNRVGARFIANVLPFFARTLVAK